VERGVHKLEANPLSGIQMACPITGLRSAAVKEPKKNEKVAEPKNHRRTAERGRTGGLEGVEDPKADQFKNTMGKAVSLAEGENRGVVRGHHAR